VAKVPPPNYLQGHAAPGVIRAPGAALWRSTPTTPATTYRGHGGQVNRNTGGYPQDPYVPGPNPALPPNPGMAFYPSDVQGWYGDLYKADEQGIAQSMGLAGQLGNAWTGGPLALFQKLMIAHGGQLPQSMVDQLKGMAAPQWKNPFTGIEGPLGLSFADALDPAKAGINVMEQAAKNPFSTVNQIARQHALANAGASANIAGRNAGRSGDAGRMFYETQMSADEQNAIKAQAVLDQLSGSYSGFLNQTLLGATATQGGYIDAAQKRIADLLAQGAIKPPTTMEELIGVRPTDADLGLYDQPPGQRPVSRPGYGQYGYKLLY
jgi:hypothetical protein